MNEPHAPTLFPMSAPYERWTRRLARAGALALTIGVLIPSLKWSEDGSVDWTWFWESSLPQSIVLLAIAAIGWAAAGWKPLLHRGRWLTCSTALALAILTNHSGFPRQGGRMSWPLGWQLLHLFLAASGLALVATQEHRRLGRLLCTLGGLYLLGVFLIPAQNWEWPILQLFLDPSGILMLPRGISNAEPITLAFQVSIGLWLLSAPMLILVGRAPRWTRVRWRVTVLAVAAAIASGWVRDFMLALARHEGPYAYVTVGLNMLLWQALSYGQVLLLGTGLFAWIVGAREERVAEAVFD